jgi:hypothetical protein
MQGEVLEVITMALVNHDVDRIKRAVMDGDEAGLDWLRSYFEDAYNTMAAVDLIYEFQARGLELVARERASLSNK